MRERANQVLVGMLGSLLAAWILEVGLQGARWRAFTTGVGLISAFVIPAAILIHPRIRRRSVRLVLALGAVVFLTHVMSLGRIRDVQLPDGARRNPALAKILAGLDRNLLDREHNKFVLNGPLQVGAIDGTNYEIHLIVPFSWTRVQQQVPTRGYAGTVHIVAVCDDQTPLTTKALRVEGLHVRPSVWPTAFLVGWFETLDAWEYAQSIAQVMGDRIDAISSSP